MTEGKQLGATGQMPAKHNRERWIRLFAHVQITFVISTLAIRPSMYAEPAAPSVNARYTAGASEASYSTDGQKQYRRPFFITDKFAGWATNPSHPIDAEPPGQHTINDFPPEPRNIFDLMDQVVTEVLVYPNGKEQPMTDGPIPEGAKKVRKLKPLELNVPDGIYDSSLPNQRAIYGRNTWMLWCGGDEDFWDWLAQHAYGVLDFLKIIDSRKRSTRLRDLGLINQPGLKSTDRPGPWGLYLDIVHTKIGVEGDRSPYKDGDYEYPSYADDEGRTLEGDGVNPRVYGYPSGVIGLRLFPNPRFNKEAQQRWNAEAFYDDPAYAKDPRTVRPFLVGMSCVVCHIGPHPLNPPLDPEEPHWSNLSCIIGNQYFRTSASFGGRVERANFLWHFLASQQPGTIDTSMVSSDHINNGNAMNAVFELPTRWKRALMNPSEKQDTFGQLLPGEGTSERRIARVLMDGADSIGLFGALARVYLNIGTYHDEWNKCSNPIIGFVPQRPFSIDVCRRNSVYWRVNENFRVGYLMDFFLWQKEEGGRRVQCSTSRMLLKDALIPAEEGHAPTKFVELPANRHHWDEAAALKGSKVFTRHCMICHSSKQPDGFHIQFAHQPLKTESNWTKSPIDPEKLTLPFDGRNWEDFKNSPAYAHYVEQAVALVGDGDQEMLQKFLDENFLSTDLRIPVSLTQTSAGRALASNAMEDQVWQEFASETYRQLPPVGPIRYYDPFSKTEKTFQPPGKGPGYYRVPSLLSIWATAPFLHNNALGHYLPDDKANRRVSVEGRLEMFDDAIKKLLWKDERKRSPSGEGGLRDPSPTVWHGTDPGWIYRTDVETEIRIPRGHVRHLIEGILPGLLPGMLASLAVRFVDHPWILPSLLVIVSILFFAIWPRAYFYLLVITGVTIIGLMAVTGIHYLLPSCIWLVPAAVVVGSLAWIVSKPRRTRIDSSAEVESEHKSRTSKALRVLPWVAVTVHAFLLMGLLAGLWFGREFINGQLGDLRLGPLPKGVPVNALMNMNPAAPLGQRLGALRGLTCAIGKLRASRQLTEAERLAVFEKEAAPALMRVSKCPDWELDRGHYFGESLSNEEKLALIAFLKTL